MKNRKDSEDSYKWITNSRYTVKSVLSFICVLAILSFLLLFITNHLITLLLTLKIVPPNLILLFSSPLYVYIPKKVTILPLDGIALYAYFLFLVFSIIASVIWIVKNESKDALKIFKDAMRFKKPLRFGSKNSFILIPQFFLIYYFFITVYWNSLHISGLYSPWSGEYPPLWELMFIYVNASVYEEIFFRLLLIGIPLFIIDFAMRKNRPMYRYIFGGGFEFDFVTILLLIISSTIFGYAHIFFPRTIYEFPPMVLIGLVFGYLFLKKGIYAAIILHFSIDYMDMLAISVVGKTYTEMLAGIANNSLGFSSAGMIFLAIPLFATFLLIIFGSVAAPFYFGFYAKKSILFMVEKLRTSIKMVRKFLRFLVFR